MLYKINSTDSILKLYMKTDNKDILDKENIQASQNHRNPSKITDLEKNMACYER